MKPLLVFGARPNFMKIAPIWRELRERPAADPVLVHTGQHFDKEMSDDFIAALELPKPDVHLGVGPGTQAWQIAEVMQRIEPVLESERPDVTVVVGDVSSTLAAALASHTRGIPVAHVEAGLRSRDWTMPEERNRVLTDRLSDYLFTPSADADENLRAEGIDAQRVHLVGNVMVDSLDWALARLGRPGAPAPPPHPERFGLVTLHRPSNVDDPDRLRAIVGALDEVGREVPLLFPVHPRTRRRMEEAGIAPGEGRLELLPPLGYARFVPLLRDAAVVLTDSGGIQEEATVLGVPCLTLRDNTERPITLEFGQNRLVGSDPARIVRAAGEVLSTGRSAGRRPPLWDGRTAERVVDVLM